MTLEGLDYRSAKLTNTKIWQGDVNNRPTEVDLPAGYTQGARVYHNTDQVIPNATATYLAFNSQRWDTDNIHDTVTNNSRLTCKTAGKYLISISLSWSPSAVGLRTVQIWLNQTTIYTLVDRMNLDSNICYMNCNTILDLAVNDFVEARVYQTSEGDRSVKASEAYSPEFMMQRIG